MFLGSGKVGCVGVATLIGERGDNRGKLAAGFDRITHVPAV